MQSLRILVATLVASGILGAIAAGPALAEDRDRDHRRDVRHVYHRPPPPRRDWGYGVATYEAAPPPVVYAPAPEPAFNLSLHFR
jgi:hypothetical protein